MVKHRREGQELVHCDACGATNARVRRVTRSYGSGADLLVIENVPVISCPACGETYMTADTAHELERLKRERHALATDRRVEVVSFVT